MESLNDLILARFNYWIYVVLMMIGLYAMITKKNLIKKLIGMSIFQTAIILFFVSVGVKEGATIPIISHHASHPSDQVGWETPSDEAETPSSAKEPRLPVIEDHDSSVDSDTFANPLPHVLMLTAIVVGVSTLGVGLSVAQRIFIRFGTLEEDIILNRIRTDDG